MLMMKSPALTWMGYDADDMGIFFLIAGGCPWLNGLEL
ncbi:hypothetical Protein YC6258_04992 [Gynuella sunshinyii YC6258]|uniref:Uncharacterized protein n=1 Tax=Gynuella sunshinyii YC6258 TaxID=1445510 RepID=A0A0C5VUP1_9GAMM|nr:hypothetical Protein YC6258_04992 [Gynuella sunshinyii YC6258]